MPTKTTAADVDPLALERQVCFALAVTNRAVLAVYPALLEPLGVTHPHYLVMLALWGHPRSSPEPLSVKQIAAARQRIPPQRFSIRCRSITVCSGRGGTSR